MLLEVTGDDHPKACTGRRLLHRGWARPVPRARSIRPSPVVLDPFAREPLSAADRPSAERAGVLAVDCSWNRVSVRGHLPEDEGGPRAGRRRRLPILVAANPQHYGRIAELNTVEALSAALYILGRAGQAAEILEGFRGGGGFLEINRVRLEAYARAADADRVRDVERELFGGPRKGPTP